MTVTTIGLAEYRNAAHKHDMNIEHFESWADAQIVQACLDALTSHGFTPEQVATDLEGHAWNILGVETPAIQAHFEAEGDALNIANALGLDTTRASIEVAATDHLDYTIAHADERGDVTVIAEVSRKDIS